MDDARFDALARAISQVHTRRGALAGVAGGLLLPLVADDLPAAGAGRRDEARGESWRHRKCPHGLTKCTFKKGKKKKHRCFDLQLDAVNCGACGTICPAGQSCCAGTCIDTRDAEANCGACGNVCTAPQTCGGGGEPGTCGCTPTTCEAEEKNCGNIPDGCGGTLDCGECMQDRQTCGGGGTPNVCGCQPNGAVVNDRDLCCSNSCCRDELPAGQCRCAGGCG